jgi:hypothetical protein
MKYAHSISTEEEIEVQLICDTTHDHYQVLDIGWSGYDRIYNPVMHLDIKNEKIWIQRNMTDIQIAEELVEMGIPREDIVLGLQAPYKRPYTRYGVA